MERLTYKEKSYDRLTFLSAFYFQEGAIDTLSKTCVISSYSVGDKKIVFENYMNPRALHVYFYAKDSVKNFLISDSFCSAVLHYMHAGVFSFDFLYESYNVSVSTETEYKIIMIIYEMGIV